MITYYFILIIFIFFSSFVFTGLWRRTPWGRKLYKSATRTPIKDKLLRGPGESLREQSNELLIDSAFNFASLYFMPFLFLAAYLVNPIDQRTPLLAAFVLILGGIYFVVMILKIRRQRQQLQNFRIGLDGEIATAQELNQLMLHGYYVYHDFPADKFNIDHIVIGSSGVYAVETKARSKPNEKGTHTAEVIIKGDVLEFPGYQNTSFVKQAKEQAKWLSDYLKKSVGKAVYVNPLLTLPGWYVSRKERQNSNLVYNPKELIGLKNEKTVLDEQTIKQIKYQIEERCRTVEPYRPA